VNSDLITAADIGRLAGFGASAVSNWRRRHADFPEPHGRAANGSALFARDEVVDYLGRHRRLRTGTIERSEVWPEALLELGNADAVLNVASALIALNVVADAAGDPIARVSVTDDQVAGRLIDLTSQLARNVPDGDMVFEPLLRDYAEGPPRRGRTESASGDQRGRLLTSVWRLIEDELDRAAFDPEAGTAKRASALERLFEELLGLRMRERSRRLSETRTASWVSRLMVEVADARHGVVFDPATGEAGFLLEAARGSGTEVTLLGQESDPETWRVARQRLLVHGVEAELRLGDSLDPGGRRNDADAVVCDPPFGLRVSPERWPPTDERWTFGIPAPNADFAWLQLAIHQLRRGGRAAVLLPASSLYQTGFEARIRVELLRARGVEAIIALPRGTRAGSQHAVAVWLLRRPEDATTGDVLLVDATDADASALAGPGDGTTGSAEVAAAGRLSQKVLSAVRSWRASGNKSELERWGAAAVPASELIAANAELVPARWTIAAPQFRLVSEIADAIDEMKALRQAPPLPELEFKEAPVARPTRLRVRQLIADGALELIAGARIASSSAAPPDPIRAWGPWDFRDEPVRYTQARDEITQTHPGDIVVLQSLGGVRAIVDEAGGRAIIAPAQAIRIRPDSEIGAQLDPRICAAFLEDAENTRVATGGTTGRVGVNELELPVLSEETSRRLSAALAALQAQKDKADELSRHSVEVRELLLSAVGSGAVELG
jgi:hypothetical protein